MRIINGGVQVRPMRDDDEIILPSGHKLYLPLTIKYHEGVTERRTECITGIVLAVPDRVPVGGNVVDSEMQVQVGDTVIYHFLAVMKKMSLEMNTLLVDYNKIFCIIRNGEIIPINGWIFCQPVLKTGVQSAFLEIVNLKVEYEPYMIAKYIGKPTERYVAAKDGVEYYIRDTEYPEIKPGMKLITERNSDVLVENSFEKMLGEPLFRIRRYQICGILE